MFTEASAKVGINVKQLFNDLAVTLPGVDSAGAGGAVGQTQSAAAGDDAHSNSFKLGGT